MFQVRDNVWLDVRLDGAEVPLDKLGFQYVRVMENNRQFLPAFEMEIADGANWMERFVKWRDGMPITISIGRSSTDKDTYRFRLYRYTRIIKNGTITYKAIGYLDSVKYLADTEFEGISGSSSQALKEIAATCGLGFEGDATADSQYWMPSNSRYCLWASEIARHGYANDESLMQMCVSLDGKMRYKNMNSPGLYRSKPRAVFVRNNAQDPQVQIVSSKAINTSGFTNMLGGYKFGLVQQSLFQANVPVVDKLQVRKITKSIDMSEDVRLDMDRGRIRVGPINCGNTHENYQRAAYQNERAAMVWSNGFEILAQQVCDPTLLDLVQITDYSQGQVIAESRMHSGLYIVTARAKQIEGSNYYEKYVVYSTGVNA